jgi:hypothetical protein
MSQTVNAGTPGVKPGMSTGTKWLIGCAVAALAFVILCVAIGGIGAWFVKKKYNEFVGQYEKQGYAKVMAVGQDFTVGEPIKAKTLYIGQSVRIMAGSEADLALFCQVAEIHGKVSGTIHFTGQSITIDKDAEVTGDLDVTAQIVNVNGVVDGNVTGKMQSLNQQGQILKGQPPAASTEAPPAPAEVQSTEPAASAAPSTATIMTLAADEVSVQSTCCGATLSPAIDSTRPSMESTAAAPAAAVTGARPARAKG